MRSLIINSFSKFSNHRLYSRAYAPNVNAYLLNRTKPAKEILSNLLPEDEKRLEQIKNEYEYLKEIGQVVPTKYDESDLLELLCLDSRGRRMSYYKFKANIEFKKMNRQKHREENPISLPEYAEEERIHYIFRNISDSFRKRLELNRLANIMANPNDHQPLIFDFSYNHLMRIQDQRNLTRQMAEIYGINKSEEDPFNFYLANIDQTKNEYQFLNKNYNLSQAIWNVQPEDIDKIPSLSDRRLIYLSPDSKTEFKNGEFDSDAGIIIGAIVDKIYKPNESIQRAKLLKLETRKIPLDRYMTYYGSKALSLITIYRIIRLAKETNGNWEKAILESIPKRNMYQKDPTLRKISGLFNSF